MKVKRHPPNLRDDLGSWRLFVSFHRARSLSEVARALGISSATASRRVAALEKSLGLALLDHGRKPVTLTNEGRLLAQEMELVLGRFDAVMAKAASREKRSVIRFVTAPIMAEEISPPIIRSFNSLTRDVRVDMFFPAREQDLADGVYDVAGLMAEPTLPGLVYLSRGRTLYIPVAAPSYLREAGAPERPEELERHRVLAYAGPARPPLSTLYCGERTFHVDTSRSPHSGALLGLKKAALAGEGVVLDMPHFLVSEELERGRLVPVLPGWSRRPDEGFVVTTETKWQIDYYRAFMIHYARHVRMFIEQAERAVAKFIAIPPPSGRWLKDRAYFTAR